MLKMIIVTTIFFATNVFAEEKSCTVKGMHCSACVEMVKEKVCDGKDFAVCDVTLKKKVGTIHIKTKDADAKVDEKDIGTAIADTTYKLDKCTVTKM